jgi:hypothetical protein
MKKADPGAALLPVIVGMERPEPDRVRRAGKSRCRIICSRLASKVWERPIADIPASGTVTRMSAIKAAAHDHRGRSARTSDRFLGGDRATVALEIPTF